MTDRELMQLALEALETKGEHHPRVYAAIAALRERLAQPDQAPRQWQGLTEEEKSSMVEWAHPDIIDAIELKLRERNT